jgi:flagellar assembly factor FliW
MARGRRSKGEAVWVPHGLVGFPGLTRFRLVVRGEEPFAVLESEEREGVRFPLIDPVLVRPDYGVDLTPDQLEELGIGESGDVRVFVIVTVPEAPKEMTVNLRAPLVVGREAGVAMQVVAADEALPVKVLVREELGGGRGEARLL